MQPPALPNSKKPGLFRVKNKKSCMISFTNEVAEHLFSWECALRYLILLEIAILS